MSSIERPSTADVEGREQMRVHSRRRPRLVRALCVGLVTVLGSAGPAAATAHPVSAESRSSTVPHVTPLRLDGTAVDLARGNNTGKRLQAGPAAVAPVPVTHTYMASTGMVANPERGFVRMVDDCELNGWAFSVQNLTKWRAEGYTLVQCVFYLQDYKGTESLGSVTQPGDPLWLIDQRLRNAKAAGVKVIMRFAYTKSMAGQDAPHSIVMKHINDIAEILSQHQSVVHVLQEGFIGAWGEGHYSLNYNTESVTEGPNWPLRNAVLGALLEKLPKSMMVQVRTPQMKQEYLLWKGVTTTRNPIPATQAWTGTDRARIGHLNDCFLKDGTDTDTYREDDGENVPPDRDDNNADRRYVADETKYVVNGGETCGVAPAPVGPADDDRHDPDCGPATPPAQPTPVGARALADLAKFHWTYLNRDKPNIVDALWVPQGCYSDIVNKLGYRFVLVKSSSSVAVVSGKRYLSVSFTVRNDGWAAPTSNRPVKLILRERAGLGAGRVSVAVPADPRKWAPGTSTTSTVTIDVTHLPSGAVHAGGGIAYDAFAQLPDSNTDLAGNLAYAIRFANVGTWTADGNKLQESYTTPTTPPAICCSTTKPVTLGQSMSRP